MVRCRQFLALAPPEALLRTRGEFLIQVEGLATARRKQRIDAVGFVAEIRYLHGFLSIRVLLAAKQIEEVAVCGWRRCPKCFDFIDPLAHIVMRRRTGIAIRHGNGFGPMPGDARLRDDGHRCCQQKYGNQIPLAHSALSPR